VVLSLEGSRAVVALGNSGKRVSVPARQLALLAGFLLDQPPPLRLGQPPWDFSLEALAAHLPPARDRAAAWLLLRDQADGLPLLEWAELLSPEPGAAQLAACWCWLEGNQDWFRLRQGLISARPLAELRRLRQERRRHILQDQEQQAWHAALRARQPLQQHQRTPTAEADLGQLLCWAAGDCSDPLPAPLLKGLQQAHCAVESGAIRHLLLDLGLWDAHHLPSLSHSSWQLGFSAEQLAEAELLLAMATQPCPGDGARRDLTALRSVTIDDEDTLDIDDGLALETLDGGRARIWIHVADPGRLVAEGSPLDLEARRRATSLYLAGGNLPMFPLELASGPFSLRAGHRCAAWSLWVELSNDGAVQASGLTPSWVKPIYRLSYADADELIELAPPPDSDLADLHTLLLLRRHWRVARGALLLDQPEGRIRQDSDQAMLEITEPSPSRLMVAEAMILAGAVAADYGRQHGLALPFRSQPPAELPPAAELDALPPGPVRHAAIKRCLSRGLTGTRPERHFSLGLDAYVQATSPIRRYADLVVQRQLRNHLEGKPPLDGDGLTSLLGELEGPLREAQQISREDQRHWQQVWFQQHHAEQWKAQFLRWLRPQDGLGLVHVEALAMDLAAHCPRGCDPGDHLLLRVRQVDPLRDQMQLITTL
jgi:exoribonuclease-2